MNDFEKIKKCIHELDAFLSRIERDYDLTISLHAFDCFFELSRREIAHNSHNVKYCELVKCAMNGPQKCRLMQCYANSSFNRNAEPRFGRCIFGVDEFVIPAFSRGKAIGFISVSGYSFDKNATRERAKHFFGSISSEMEAAICELESMKPDPVMLLELLSPAADLLGLIHFHVSSKRKTADFIQSSIMVYILDHYCEPLTVKQLAKKVNCSESFINHTFKNKYGCSFSAYINSLRIARAKQLLLEMTRPVSDVAYSIGFNDANYFSSVFKNETGYSPLEFRRKFRK